MANIIANTLTSIFGGKKSDKDVKSIQPIVVKINEHFKQLASLSHDELRNKTQQFRAIIQEKLSDIQSKIDHLKKHTDDGNLSLDGKGR